MQLPTQEEITESIVMISVISFLSLCIVIFMVPAGPNDFGDDKPILKRVFGFLHKF
jgi:hypothetical protein